MELAGVITEAKYAAKACPQCGHTGHNGPREVRPSLDKYIVSFNDTAVGIGDTEDTNDYTGPDINSLAEFVVKSDPDNPMIWVPKQKFTKEIKEWLGQYANSVIGVFLDKYEYENHGEVAVVAIMHTGR